MNFSIELAKSLMESSDEFPVDFDDAWVWLGYSRKDKALKALKTYFVEGEDFTFPQSGEWKQGGRSKDFYRLSTNCLKEFGMIAKTEQGKLVRKYFIECEKIAKATVQAAQPQTQPVIMPTSEQLEFMRSRAWEKAELEGKPMSRDEIMARSGYGRAFAALHPSQSIKQSTSLGGNSAS